MTAPRHRALPRSRPSGRRRGARRIPRDIVHALAETAPKHRKDPS